MKMKTNIYALTDSHQESRNLSRLLSGIYNYEKDNCNPFLILDAGDLFKGIYDKELSVNAYLKIKELLPQSEIFITLGNNDFGFKKADFEFLKDTIKKFQIAGINVVCANVRPQIGIPYKIININEQKILITGLCLNNASARKFGCELLPQQECIEELLKSVEEDYDKIIVLNHHWYTYSRQLKDKIPQIDLIIGGHEHSPISPDYENNIFYPYSFARTMYRITMDENIEDIEQIPGDGLNFTPEFEKPIIRYEREVKLYEPMVRRVLDLTKCYSDPCPLGTFISDAMKKAGNTDIAFHSTGFTMYPMRLSDSETITKYDFERVICAATTIETAEINTEQLKNTFENAAKFRMYKDRGNTNFLQCSQNVKIAGTGNPEDKTYKILQISIDDEDLLDENQKPLNPERKFTCTIDSFIGSGELGFKDLKELSKTKVIKNNSDIKINELFLSALFEAEKTYKNPCKYPSFKWLDM